MQKLVWAVYNLGSHFGIQNKVANVYIASLISGVPYLQDFYIKCSNLLSFELLKHLKWQGVVPPDPCSVKNPLQKSWLCTCTAIMHL